MFFLFYMINILRYENLIMDQLIRFITQSINRYDKFTSMNESFFISLVFFF